MYLLDSPSSVELSPDSDKDEVESGFLVGAGDLFKESSESVSIRPLEDGAVSSKTPDRG